MILTDRKLYVFWEVIKKRCAKHFQSVRHSPPRCTSVLRDTTFYALARLKIPKRRWQNPTYVMFMKLKLCKAAFTYGNLPLRRISSR